MNEYGVEYTQPITICFIPMFVLLLLLLLLFHSHPFFSFESFELFKMTESNERTSYRIRIDT